LDESGHSLSEEKVKTMAYLLRLIYDDQDNLEAWLPEFDDEKRYDTDPGPYDLFDNACLKGTAPVMDSLLILDFSAAYPNVIEEVRSKEDSVSDRYDVPEFGLYNVPLSEILEYIYRTLVPDWRKERHEPVTVVETQRGYSGASWSGLKSA
jgi:hypothetical protein